MIDWTQKGRYERNWVDAEQFTQQDPTTPARKALLAAAVQRYLGRAEGAALDVGCGAGEFVAYLGSLGFQAHGVDLSENAVAYTQQRCPEATVCQASAEDGLPFPPEQFTLVMATEVVEHLLEPQQAINQMARVLRPGGVLILTTPYHGVLKNLWLALFHFEQHFGVEGGHIRFFTRRSLGKGLRDAGLQVLEQRGYGRRWPVYKSIFAVARKA